MIPENKKKFLKIINQARKNKEIHCVDFYSCINEDLLSTSPEIIFIILCLSHAIHDGNSCLPIKLFENKKYMMQKNKIFSQLLSLIKENNDNWINLALNSIHCSNGTQKTLLVKERKYIYLYKYWYSENKIIEFIHKKNLKKKSYNLIKYQKLIKKYCTQKMDPQQIKSIKNALLNNICFIIGGPGTGKTYILAYIILILIKSSKKTTNIQLAAPTGKAAIKLMQSICLTLKKKNLNTKDWLSLPKQGTTLHNLFQIPKDTHQNYQAKNKRKKKIDTLIIDESSMIDLNMMDIIVTHVSVNTKIILVGDVNQLPSVEVGNVLQDLCNKTSDNKNQSNTNISVLKKKYRFNEKSGINMLIKILENKKYNALYTIYNNTYTDVVWKEIKTEKKYLEMLKQTHKYYEKYRNFLNINYIPEKIIKKFNKYRILCAVKKGSFGTKKINKHLNQLFVHKQIKASQKIKHYTENKIWFHGKPVIIKKNNTALKLMNGDIGICLLTKKKMKLFFMLANKTIKIIDPKVLLNYETAWSMTIHKAQGSEFSSVQIIIPSQLSRIISKELFYTAITRARKKIYIYCCKKIINIIIKNDNKRYSGLSEKLISLKKI